MKVIAVIDADRAERIAAGIPAPGRATWPRADALTQVAAAIASTDPDRAVQIAVKLGGDAYLMALFFAELARVTGATDRGRATVLAEQASRSLERVGDGYFASEAKVKVAQAMAVADPGSAERIAEGIAGSIMRDEAFAAVARALALTSPGRAACIAAGIENDYDKAMVLAEIARAVSASDLPRAAEIALQADLAAESVDDEDRRIRVYIEITGLRAVTDLQRAEEPAAAITSTVDRELVLAEVAGSVAVRDPARADRIAEAITDPSRKAGAYANMARAWLKAAK